MVGVRVGVQMGGLANVGLMFCMAARGGGVGSDEAVVVVPVVACLKKP